MKISKTKKRDRLANRVIPVVPIGYCGRCDSYGELSVKPIPFEKPMFGEGLVTFCTPLCDSCRSELHERHYTTGTRRK